MSSSPYAAKSQEKELTGRVWRSPSSSLKPLARIQDSKLEVRDFLSTGIGDLDQLLQGGIPRGRITEIMGSYSSGRTALLFSVLAQCTERAEITAYIDITDSLDPKSARKSGVDLDRLLWIRCRDTENGLDPLQKALKAADILCQAGGFGVIAFDIVNLKSARISLNSWFRLQRLVKGTPTVLLVVSEKKITGSASSLVLSLERNRSYWTSGKRSRVMQKPCFQGIESEAHLLKGGGHGSITLHCRF